MQRDIGRAVWMDGHRKGIGGTDAAAILGLSPYTTPLQVFLRKRNEAPKPVETPPMRWGLLLEPVIARNYAEETNAVLWKPDRPIVDPDHPELVGWIDYFVENHKLGVECKNDRWGDGWGEPGTDEIPAAHLVQCQHYMALTGFPRWDVPVLIGGNDRRTYTVEADVEFQEWMKPILVEWWQKHVVGGVRPEMDGSEETSRWIADRFPEHKLPIAPAPLMANDLAVKLRDARLQIEGLEELKAAFENALKEVIGERAGIEGPGWRATWKRTRPRSVVAWEHVARGLLSALERSFTGPDKTENAKVAAAMFKQIVELQTTEVPGSRRFLFSHSLAPAKEPVAAAAD